MGGPPVVGVACAGRGQPRPEPPAVASPLRAGAEAVGGAWQRGTTCGSWPGVFGAGSRHMLCQAGAVVMGSPVLLPEVPLGLRGSANAGASGCATQAGAANPHPHPFPPPLRKPTETHARRQEGWPGSRRETHGVARRQRRKRFRLGRATDPPRNTS